MLQGTRLSPVTAATPAPAATADPGRPGSHGPAWRGPWLLVGAAVVWNLLSLRAETLGVSYLDDSSVHEQMVRFATAQLRSGRLPLESWFPFLGQGSPQFLHYQSLPAMLTAVAGLVIGPDAAFRWTLYLLLSVWPIAIYLSARLLGAGRPASAAAAAMSPFLVSKTGIGYEQNAYVWIGYGVWTQLWASVTLPLAWGFSWRAIREGRGWFAAVALVSLTIALHFETGYLALLPLLLWPFVAGRPIATSARRAATVAAGALLAAGWVIVPLIDQRSWAATNEALRGTTLENGYGAARVLGWLGSGQLLDHGRLPVVTAFAAIGVVLAVRRWRSGRAGRAGPSSRALLVALAGCLVLSFGRTTFGSLAAVIPGSGDIFFRRFMMGVQLAALLLAGRGAAWCAGSAWNALERLSLRRRLPPDEALRLRLAWRWANPRMGRVRTAVAAGAMIVVLTPAWLQERSFDRRNAAHIAAQRRADATQGAQVDQLIALIQANGGGRVYAGMPSNWGTDFTVGAVPVFKYLESKDVDEVGYTLRTASLMTGPEDYFDELDPADYELFGIRYLILPSGSPPPVPADEVAVDGPYALWTTSTTGYVHVGTIAGALTADRTNLGVRSIPLLQSGLADSGDFLRIFFGGRQAALPPLPRPSRRASAGNVISESDNLEEGAVSATVTMRRPGVAVLSASFDDGWTATVDGRPMRTTMVAPALVATDVPAGTHTVAFRYRGYSGYPELFALCALTLAAFAGADAVRRRQARSRS
jgi:hypothetical protein